MYYLYVLFVCTRNVPVVCTSCVNLLNVLVTCFMYWLYILGVCISYIYLYNSDMANIQPHAAYAAFVHGIRNQWSYLMRTTPDLEDLLHPLEETIVEDFLQH